jgi:RNA recognition motif-containing protein
MDEAYRNRRDRNRPQQPRPKTVALDLEQFQPAEGAAANATTLFVTNLAPQTTEKFLFKEFARYGAVSEERFGILFSLTFFFCLIFE